MECFKVVTKADIELCKEAILDFRKNLDPELVVDQVFEMISREGFELVFIKGPCSCKASAFVGYRKLRMLRTGPIIYVDDLFTSPANRGKGYAGALLDHIAKEAADSGINSRHLDSGYSLHPAHRLYLNKGYFLACNHFAKTIT